MYMHGDSCLLQARFTIRVICELKSYIQLSNGISLINTIFLKRALTRISVDDHCFKTLQKHF